MRQSSDPPPKPTVSSRLGRAKGTNRDPQAEETVVGGLRIKVIENWENIAKKEEYAHL